MTDLFGVPVPDEEPPASKKGLLPDRLLRMHRLHGHGGGLKCGTCLHCLRFDYHRRVYFKCELSHISHGAGTDWRVSWPACGKHSEGPL